MKKQDLIKLMKAKIIATRKMQDYMTSKGKYDRAEYYKKQRWNYEDLLEIFTSESKFKSEMKLYSLELEEVEKESL